MRMPLVLVLGLVASAAMADPFENGDKKAGNALLEKSCSPCHVRQFGGDGSSVYTRVNRIVNSPTQLMSRIRVCNANSNAGWFPEEERHVAAYLNLSFYHLK